MNSLLKALQEGRMVEMPDDGNKDRALVLLANLIEAVPSVPAGTDVAGGVLARERTGNTALGKGWACPHARIDNEGDLICAVGWSPSGLDYSAPDGQPVRLVAMYLVPFSQKNAYLREVSGIARVLKSQPETLWANIRDLTQARNALLDMMATALETTGPEARARMIQLEARQAAAPRPISVVTLAGLSVQPLTVVAGALPKPIVLSQHRELTALLESAPELAATLGRQGFMDIGGWRILSRGATPYSADRVVYDCLAMKNLPEKNPLPTS